MKNQKDKDGAEFGESATVAQEGRPRYQTGHHETTNEFFFQFFCFLNMRIPIEKSVKSNKSTEDFPFESTITARGGNYVRNREDN